MHLRPSNLAEILIEKVWTGGPRICNKSLGSPSACCSCLCSEVAPVAWRETNGPWDLDSSMIELSSFCILGVSNWGGYALACALYILNSCPVHEHYLRRATGPSREAGEQSWIQALPSVAKVIH